MSLSASLYALYIIFLDNFFKIRRNTLRRYKTMQPWIAIVIGVCALAVGIVAGVIIRKNIAEKQIGSAEAQAKNVF